MPTKSGDLGHQTAKSVKNRQRSQVAILAGLDRKAQLGLYRKDSLAPGLERVRVGE